MLIPVRGPDGEARSWIMIELQGEVERKDGGSLSEQFDIGTLSLSSTVRCAVWMAQNCGFGGCVV